MFSAKVLSVVFLVSLHIFKIVILKSFNTNLLVPRPMWLSVSVTPQSGPFVGLCHLFFPLRFNHVIFSPDDPGYF